MKLYYCPSFSGFVYTDLSKILFNEKIVNTAGLVETIKLHAGLGTERKDDIDRNINYYKAMKKYMKENPSNIMKESFDVDGLSVAKTCLFWRDALTKAGWNKSSKCPSKRMEVLSGIEGFFSDKSLGEELVSVIKEVKAGCLLPCNLEIETPFDYMLFSPLEVELLEALKARNVSVQVKEIPEHKKNALSDVMKIIEGNGEEKVKIKKDNSFQILHFEEQDDASKYLSMLEPDSYDVWINSDNKVLDNWLYLEGKPASGSTIKGGMPQITQLLSIGLGTLKAPLDLKKLFDWLSIPLSPLYSGLRKKLEAVIAKEGGYYNEDCRNIINDFINCRNNFEKLSERETKEKLETVFEERKSVVEKFLPDINSPENLSDDSLSINKVRTFTKSLYNWCGTEIGNIQDDMQRLQLAIVRNQCTAVLAMLDSENGKRIGFTNLMAFVTNLNEGVELVQYKAQSGCRTVISNPGQINSPFKSLIWCDFYDEPKESLEYDFLLPDEKKEFAKSLKLWAEDTEREYNRKIMMLPFRFSEKVTLVVIDRKVTEDVEKHPVYIQMENKIENLSDFIKSPDFGEEHEHILSSPSIINNGMDLEAEGLTIKNAKLIDWRDCESYSSLDQLIYNPFDYVFSYLADISSLGSSTLPEVNAVHGTVAHAVIETLFNRQEGIEGSGKPDFIKENIKNNFDKVFIDMVNGHGAVLLLKENILNLENYRKQVLECVKALAKVIEENKLHVIACEPWLENSKMDFYKNIKIGGYADMILCDENENPVVFDFKWYPGKEDFFVKTIRENKSIQLELYKNLTKEIAGKTAKSVAYVVLPKVIVISSEYFEGESSIRVTVEDVDGPLLPKIKNSYKYRREQISKGFIEEATGFPPDLITYENDAEKKNLLHLNFDGTKDPKKQAKKYPEYDFFKAKK